MLGQDPGGLPKLQSPQPAWLAGLSSALTELGSPILVLPFLQAWRPEEKPSDVTDPNAGRPECSPEGGRGGDGATMGSGQRNSRHPQRHPEQSGQASALRLARTLLGEALDLRGPSAYLLHPQELFPLLPMRREGGPGDHRPGKPWESAAGVPHVQEAVGSLGPWTMRGPHLCSQLPSPAPCAGHPAARTSWRKAAPRPPGTQPGWGAAGAIRPAGGRTARRGPHCWAPSQTAGHVAAASGLEAGPPGTAMGAGHGHGAASWSTEARDPSGAGLGQVLP